MLSLSVSSDELKWKQAEKVCVCKLVNHFSTCMQPEVIAPDCAPPPQVWVEF